MMKDTILLIITALIFSGVGWLFWHYAGDYGSPALVTFFMVLMAVDNYRLRKALREQKKLNQV